MFTLREYIGGSSESAPIRRVAWVTLVMKDYTFALGGMALAQSLRKMKTIGELVCMVTSDIPKHICQLLLGNVKCPLFDRVIEVPYINKQSMEMASARQREMYSAWIGASFTKWNCLGLVEYDKIILVDADMLFLTNCDDLFDLNTPAGCFTSPLAVPWNKKGGLPNPYLDCKRKNISKCDIPHRAKISTKDIDLAMKNNGYVGWAALCVLTPDAKLMEDYHAMLDSIPIFGQGIKSVSGHDEVSLAMIYSNRVTHWTNIHQRYLAIPWKKSWVSANIRALHYHGRKPWDMDVKEWPDLIDWWKMVDSIIYKFPAVKSLFYPKLGDATLLDIEMYQLRITQDIKNITIGTIYSAPRNKLPKVAISKVINPKLSNYVMELANTNAETKSKKHWAVVYGMGEGNPNVLTAELATSDVVDEKDSKLIHKIVDDIKQLIMSRVSGVPRMSGNSPAIVDGKLTYGGHFTAYITPRIQLLLDIGGLVSTTVMLIRYATMDQADQLVVSSARLNYLYDTLDVKHEAFASPLDSGLFGKSGVTYYSLFPDMDTKFGSSGNFFTSDIFPTTTTEGWFIHPPPVQSIASRVVSKLANIGNAIVVILIPTRFTEECSTLYNHVGFVTKYVFPPGTTTIFERSVSTESYTYYMLAPPAESRSSGRLALAIAHIQTNAA